ncbi:Ran-binding-domain-containing protein [Hortaea werneckii]|uniref:Ran-binding-domain-containing protein n=1 Tax=Hortaea werneckii TaxID=91943 RepID=A0A3M7CB77_HORWE|nr:Ran-binding-domain-containing protein [Hortaea werneckii]RMY49422.1 hypothetical protein D0865_07495 [Hortaea werneckii]
MDAFLKAVTAQTFNFAIRSGITITSTYAIKQCSRLLRESPKSKAHSELQALQIRLDSKIRIISPAIDMIELISARGNTSLESAVNLTKEIRYEIQRLGTRLGEAAEEEKLIRRGSSRAKGRDECEAEFKAIIADIKALLERVEDAIPLINLAITTSGVNLSTKLSATISPSRLLQASTFLTAADSKFTVEPNGRQQVGPTWTVSLYMLFAGHANRMASEDAKVRETTWKEVIHKARIKLVRVPLDQLYSLPGEQSQSVSNGLPSKDTETMRGDAKAAEYAYQLLLIEDLDDDRVHTFDDDEPQPGPFEDVAQAGIRDLVPIHEASKIFYADTGKILGIGGDSEVNSPVLLLKRDVHAQPPRRMLRREDVEPGLDDDSYFGSPVSTSSDGVDVQRQIDAQFERESNAGTPMKEGQGVATQTQRVQDPWRLPADLDPEWMALEVFTEESEDEGDELEPSTPPYSHRPTPSGPEASTEPLTGAFSKLHLRSSVSASPAGTPPPNTTQRQLTNSTSPTKSSWPPIKTSLSLLEMLIKLTALQQFRQDSHLSIEDELLNFFLEDSATAGAGFDKSQRQRIRKTAVERVGFDPYDESPVKRRGEEYISHPRGMASPRPSLGIAPRLEPDTRAQDLPYDEAYTYDDREDGLAPTSPSPMPPLNLLRQTPSRSSTPASLTEKGGRSAAQPLRRPSSLQTPPSTARTRSGVAKADGQRSKVKSPLGKEDGRAHDDDEEAPQPGP